MGGVTRLGTVATCVHLITSLGVTLAWLKHSAAAAVSCRGGALARHWLTLMRGQAGQGGHLKITRQLTEERRYKYLASSVLQFFKVF